MAGICNGNCCCKDSVDEGNLNTGQEEYVLLKEKCLQAIIGGVENNEASKILKNAGNGNKTPDFFIKRTFMDKKKQPKIHYLHFSYEDAIELLDKMRTEKNIQETLEQNFHTYRLIFNQQNNNNEYHYFISKEEPVISKEEHSLIDKNIVEVFTKNVINEKFQNEFQNFLMDTLSECLNVDKQDRNDARQELKKAVREAFDELGKEKLLCQVDPEKRKSINQAKEALKEHGMQDILLIEIQESGANLSQKLNAQTKKVFCLSQETVGPLSEFRSADFQSLSALLNKQQLLLLEKDGVYYIVKNKKNNANNAVFFKPIFTQITDDNQINNIIKQEDLEKIKSAIGSSRKEKRILEKNDEEERKKLCGAKNNVCSIDVQLKETSISDSQQKQNKERAEPQKYTIFFDKENANDIYTSVLFNDILQQTVDLVKLIGDNYKIVKKNRQDIYDKTPQLFIVHKDKLSDLENSNKYTVLESKMLGEQQNNSIKRAKSCQNFGNKESQNQKMKSINYNDKFEQTIDNAKKVSSTKDTNTNKNQNKMSSN